MRIAALICLNLAGCFDFRYYSIDYPEAVNYLLNGSSAALTRVNPMPTKLDESFELPPRNDNMRRVYRRKL